jgi:hypothetical protein
MPLLEHVGDGVVVLLGVLAFRAFPVLVAFVADQACSARQKLGAVGLYTLISYCAIVSSDFRPHQLLFAYAYLGAASLIPYFLGERIPQRLRLAVLCALFLVLPGSFVAGEPPIVVLGWELVLSVHSYCRQVSPRARSLMEYWFFCFVNPTLAYPKRGTRVAAAGVHWPGLARATVGGAALAVAGFGYSLAPRVAELQLAIAGPLASLAARLLALYAAHSGLASLQIGLFRQLGYVAPERYLKPYRARSLRDFWARWNTYVGDWVRLYVFEPSIRALMKSPAARGWSRVAIHGLALAASFGAVGALHDVYAIAVKGEFTLAMTLWFVANAALLVAGDAAVTQLRQRGHARVFRLAAPTLLIGAVTGLAISLP